jgi:UDP:flavonoid glycosyltransferase YjiC (YdhE family)
VEVIGNSLHIPAELNLLWSYPSITPRTFLDGRKKARYEFAGYLSDGHARRKSPPDRPLVYLSFGTEVMDNLWPTEEATRAGVRRCVTGLAQIWNHKFIDVVFVTQGKPVLDDYPANWAVYDKVDQQEVLSRSDVFVTHGGGNSFHEAVLAKMPIVVVPFFADQLLVGARAEELGIGINMVEDVDIDKNKPKEFLNAKLVERIDGAVFQILGNEKYRKGFDDLSLEALPSLAGFLAEYDGAVSGM